jgi:hypothetical protein
MSTGIEAHRFIMQSAPMLSIFLAGLITITSPALAQLPWCAIMNNDGNAQCSYSTQQQCLETLSGIGGECIPNPAGNTPQPAPGPPSSENDPGLLPLQLESPGPPPGLGGSQTQIPYD